MAKELYTIRETAEKLGVSLQTLRNWDNSDKFTSTRMSSSTARMYEKTKVDNFINNKQIKNKGDYNLILLVLENDLKTPEKVDKVITSMLDYKKIYEEELGIKLETDIRNKLEVENGVDRVIVDKIAYLSAKEYNNYNIVLYAYNKEQVRLYDILAGVLRNELGRTCTNIEIVKDLINVEKEVENAEITEKIDFNGMKQILDNFDYSNLTLNEKTELLTSIRLNLDK